MTKSSKIPLQDQRVSGLADAGGSHPPENSLPFVVEARTLDKLVPFARNSRTHSPAQVAQIAASIREWGFTNPILIDERDTILAGHGRLAAATKLGMAEVPVIVARNWTESQKRAYVIADNKLAMNSGWNSELLAVELKDLAMAGFDLIKTGFEGDELAGLLGDMHAAETPEEIAPAIDDVKFLLLVEVANESEQAKLFDELKTRGLDCKVMN